MTDPAPYLSADDLRAVGILDDTGKFTAESLADHVSIFESRVERHLGRAFRPRTTTVYLDGSCAFRWSTGSPVATTLIVTPLLLPLTAVTSVTIDGTELSADELAAITVWPDGRLVRSSGWAGKQIVLEVEYGEEEPTPGLLLACQEYVRAKATTVAGNLPRTGAVPLDGQGAQWTTPGPRTEPTGVPTADDLINAERSDRIPGIA